MVIRDVAREELKRGLADGSILLVDVREPHEFAGGHIPGAVSYPLSTFDPAELGALVAEGGDRRPVLSCAAGIRSQRALEWAQAAGLPLDAHYAGGWRDWVMNGEEVA